MEFQESANREDRFALNVSLSTTVNSDADFVWTWVGQWQLIP